MKPRSCNQVPVALLMLLLTMHNAEGSPTRGDLFLQSKNFKPDGVCLSCKPNIVDPPCLPCNSTSYLISNNPCTCVSKWLQVP